MTLSSAYIPLLRRQNRFTFPNRNPGFDPSHPAASTVQNFSVVCSYSTPTPIRIDRSGPLGTAGTGAATAVMDGQLGPCTSFVNNSSGYTWTTGFNTTTTLTRPYTAAGIFRATAAFISGNAFIISGATSGASIQVGVGLASTGTTINIVNGGSASYNWTVGHAYFVAASGTTSTGSFVILDMTNGLLFSGTFSGLTGAAALARVGVGGDARSATPPVLGGSLACAMLSWGTFVQRRELLEWAQDPWSFWYPYTQVDTLDWLATPPPPALMGQILT